MRNEFDESVFRRVAASPSMVNCYGWQINDEREVSAISPPRVFVLGSSFAGLTTARFLHAEAGSGVEITVIDRSPYLTFVCVNPLEVSHLT